MPQYLKVYFYLLKHNEGLTQRDAIWLGIYRLGARIFDLKQMGVKIKTVKEQVTNRDGSTTYIARYFLDDRDKERLHQISY